MHSAPSIERLLGELECLPGIGPKSAQRILYYIMNCDDEKAQKLADSIREVKQNVHFCEQCFNYSEEALCSICQSYKRNTHQICVVAEPRDIPPIERSNAYQGLYHVLGGVISPLEGQGPEDIRIKELMARLANNSVEEIILALSPNIEGETTASYLARILKPFGIVVSKLASGLPVGGDLEFADEVTLGRAIESRLVIEE